MLADARATTRGAFLTLPNVLALSRVVLGLAFWAAVRSPPLALAVIVVAGLTDVLDGWLARRLGLAQPGGVGAWLDPACDKFFVVSVLTAVYVARGPPLWMVALVGARELVLVPLALVYRAAPRLRQRMRYDFRAGLLGKAATVAQFAAAVAILAGHRAQLGLAAAACAIGLLAAGGYIRRARGSGGARVIQSS